jgi:hypothetical protein
VGGWLGVHQPEQQQARALVAARLADTTGVLIVAPIKGRRP